MEERYIMAARWRASTTNELYFLLDADVGELQNTSAREYLSDLNKYLKNLTLVWSRPHLHERVPVDRDDGIIWVIIIPIIYFAVVSLVLGILLLFFWYVDNSGLNSAAHSEASLASTAANIIRHETVVVDHDVDNAFGPSVVRSYLLNTTNFQNKFRSSGASKGSTRSLGVLTERDLQLPHSMKYSVTSNFTVENVRLSRNTQECFGGNITLADNYNHKIDNKGGQHRSEFSSTSHLEMSDFATISSQTDQSFSTDSLEEVVFRASLRAIMESQKGDWASNGKIGPEDMYNHNKAAPEMEKEICMIDTDINCIADSEKENIEVLKSSIVNDMTTFRGNNGQSFKIACRVALDRDTKTAVHYKTIDKGKEYPFQKSNDSFPSRMVTCVQDNTQNCLDLSKCASLGHAYANDNHKLESIPGKILINQYERSNRSFTNTRTDVHNIYSLTYTDDECTVDDVGVDILKTNFSRFDSGNYATSTTLNPCESHENVVEDPYSSDVSETQENYQQFETENADLNVSSVSEIVINSSEDCNTPQDSTYSNNSGSDDGSQYSATRSLPSSISKFHASKVGYFPSPSAGYPIHCEEHNMLDVTNESENNKIALHCDGNYDDRVDRSSMSANYGSCSQSSEANYESCSQSSEANNIPLRTPEPINVGVSQDGSCHQKSKHFKHDSGFVKLTKRPSPVSSFVHNLRQRYSLDENFLRNKRLESEEEEEEALIRSDHIAETQFKRGRHTSFELKRDKVTVEQRLQEFGFLKVKGKNKYVINPSPGKFETGSEYLMDEVFPQNRGIASSSLTSDSENDWKQNHTPKSQIYTRRSYTKSDLVQGDKCRDKLVSSQLISESSNLYHSPPYIQRPINKMQFEQGVYLNDLVSDDMQFEGEMFEIHGDGNMAFSETELEHMVKRKVINRQTHSNHEQDSSSHSSRRHVQETLFGKKLDVSGKEYLFSSCKNQTNFNMQPNGHESIHDCVKQNTEIKNIAVNNSDLNHTSYTYCKTPSIDLENNKMFTDSNRSVIETGLKLKRQQTHRSLVTFHNDSSQLLQIESSNGDFSPYICPGMN